MSKFLKFIVNLFLICAILAAAAILIPPLVGIQTTIVDSASMDTNLPLGSITYSTDILADQLKNGDEVLKDSSSSTYAYIIKGKGSEANQFRVVSASDQNGAEETVTFEGSVPRVRVVVPYLGYLIIAMHSTEGLIIIGLVVALVIILFILSELWKKEPADEEDAEDTDAGQAPKAPAANETEPGRKDRKKRKKEEKARAREEKAGKKEKKQKNREAPDAGMPAPVPDEPLNTTEFNVPAVTDETRAFSPEEISSAGRVPSGKVDDTDGTSDSDFNDFVLNSWGDEENGTAEKTAQPFGDPADRGSADTAAEGDQLSESSPAENPENKNTASENGRTEKEQIKNSSESAMPGAMQAEKAESPSEDSSASEMPPAEKESPEQVSPAGREDDGESRKENPDEGSEVSLPDEFDLSEAIETATREAEAKAEEARSRTTPINIPKEAFSLDSLKEDEPELPAQDQREFVPVEHATLDELLDKAKKAGEEPEVRKDDATGITFVDYSDEI